MNSVVVSVMIPMVKVAKVLGIINTRPGVIIVYFGFGMPLTVFVLHGFVTGVPKELERLPAAGAGYLPVLRSAHGPLGFRTGDPDRR
jgi:ABC-type maltose transport system permease subunit